MSQSIVSVAPFHMKYSRKSDFEPEFVSIGPYYHRKLEGSQHMEDIKNRCTKYFYNKLQLVDSSTTTTESIDDHLADNSTATTESIDDQPADNSTPTTELLHRISPYDMKTKIRNWYGGSIDDLDQKKLFEILLRDSCFVITIILSVAGGPDESTFFKLIGRDIKRIRFDLLLLENQIPFFFLMKVYEFFLNNGLFRQSESQSARNSASNSQNGISNQSNAQGPTSTWLTSLCCVPRNVQSPVSDVLPPQSNTSLQDSSSQSIQEQTGSTSVHNSSSQNPQDTPQSDILKRFLKELEPFICLDMPWKFNEYEINEEPCHLLDLYWRRCLPLNDESLPSEDIDQQNRGEVTMPSSWVTIQVRTNAPKRIKNAHELYKRAGVKFGKMKHDEGFGLTFQKKGILQLPHLQLDPSQAKLLVNLVAFEEYKPSSKKILTSYVLLIDGLINTEKDVELLQRYNVLTNKLGSSQMASVYFNDIGNLCSVNYEDHYCQEQFKGLNNYYNSYWRCKFAILKNKYFNSPWSVISFFAGLALLAITIAQLVLASINTHLNLKHHKN